MAGSVTPQDGGKSPVRIAVGAQYILLTFAGGLIGAYAYRICGILATAQTGAMMSALWAFRIGDAPVAWSCVLGVALYALGITATILLPRALHRQQLRWEPVCLALEIALLLTVPLIPAQAGPILRAAPIFMVGALQLNTFTAFGDVPITTLFCTNNFRQFVVHFWNYRLDRDTRAGYRALVYACAVFIFLSGVVVGYWGLYGMGEQEIYLPCAVLLAVLVMQLSERKGS